MTKGEKIANLVAELFNEHGGVGPFGGESVPVKGNEITLTSQSADTVLRFNDDGSVDFVNIEDSKYEYLSDLGYNMYNYDEDDEEFNEAEEEWNYFVENFSHFNSVEELFNCDLSWFMQFDEDEVDYILSNISHVLNK